MATYSELRKNTLNFQRLLKFAGYYQGQLDGLMGPLTHLADEDWRREHAQLAERFGAFCDRTEKQLLTVVPALALSLRKMLAELRRDGADWVLTCGTRSYNEQDALYAQGRSKSGARVTNAQGGQSYHNFGMAVDFVLIKDCEALWDAKYYKALGELAKRYGLVWGGTFRSLADCPHVQLGNFSCSYLASIFEGGRYTVADIIK